MKKGTRKTEWVVQFKSKMWCDCYEDGCNTKKEAVELIDHIMSREIETVDPVKYRLIRRETIEFAEDV